MTLGSVTKPDKRNTATSKKIDYNVVSANYDVIVNVPISGRFGAILLFSLIAPFNLTKTENTTKTSWTQFSYYWND